MSDRRAVEVVVYEKGVRKVVGRAMTNKKNEPIELLIDDLGVAKILAGSFQGESMEFVIKE